MKKNRRNQARASITEDGKILLVAEDENEQILILALEQIDAESLLYDLHSAVETMRGVNKPTGILNRILFFLRGV